MKRLFPLLLIMLLVFTITPFIFAASTPTIVVYNNSGSIPGSAKSDPAQINEIRQWIREKTGVDVIVIAPPPGQEETKLNLMLASGEQVDAFWGNWTKYSGKGIIMPITKLIGQAPVVKKAWPKESWQSLTDSDGKIWGVPRLTPFLGNPLWVRTDWLDKVGLKMPTNVAELEVVLKAFKEKQPGGDGTIPLLAEVRGKHDSRGLCNALVGAFTPYGYTNWYDKKDGKLKIAQLQPGYKDFLAKMNDWYQKGYIYPEFASLDRPRIRELVRLNRVGTAATWYSNITNTTMWQLAQTVPGAKYEFPVGGLVGPMGKAETGKGATNEGMLISARCKNPAALMKVMNFLYSSPENHMKAWFGPEGNTWQWTDKSKFIYKTIKPQAGYTAGICLYHRAAHGDFGYRRKPANGQTSALLKERRHGLQAI